MSDRIQELRKAAGISLFPRQAPIEELFYERHPNGIHLYPGPRTTHEVFPSMTTNPTLAVFSWDREPLVEWLVETFNSQPTPEVDDPQDQ